MTDIDWSAVKDLAQRVGRNYARQWPGIDADDISGEILLRLVESPAILNDFKEKPAVLTSIMGKIARSYCSAERYFFTVSSARYLYTPKEIRGFLTHAYWDESLRETSVPTGPEDRTALLTWQNVCIALWDIDSAFSTLSAVDRARLTLRFRDGQEYATDAARKAVDRAIDTLTQRVNERINRVPIDHDGPGSRLSRRTPAAA
ncbi:hypothetical protein [Kitasatospora aureofaciens]|uniref:hypothetical protein n=1 Tax=Kitasatospora aureofaciens TaxID=1894 RepID=UPI0033C6363F